MKFYSEVTKKFYDTVEDCESAEVAVKRAQEEKELAKKKLSEARASRAKEVENLRYGLIYQNYINVLYTYRKVLTDEDLNIVKGYYQTMSFPKLRYVSHGVKLKLMIKSFLIKRCN